MNYLEDIEMICDVCGAEFVTDGYVWTCDECRHPKKDCECGGGDDVLLDWEIKLDQNGDLIPVPVWRVECAMCERRTAFFSTAKEAYDAWTRGEAFTPIPGTGHFEEVW